MATSLSFHSQGARFSKSTAAKSRARQGRTPFLGVRPCKDRRFAVADRQFIEIAEEYSIPSGGPLSLSTQRVNKVMAGDSMWR
jgi:hypothetical protein